MNSTTMCWNAQYSSMIDQMGAKLCIYVCPSYFLKTKLIFHLVEQTKLTGKTRCQFIAAILRELMFRRIEIDYALYSNLGFCDGLCRIQISKFESNRKRI